MTVAAYGEWFARGCNHQRDGRLVDAMVCFRRALREAPGATDARFHLGEVLWQLGRLADAIGAWREAAQLTPDQVAPQQALAEALLVTGDAPGARVAAECVLRLLPDDSRARAIVALAPLIAEQDARAFEAIAEALVRDPLLVETPSIAGALAIALDGGAASARAPLLDTVIPLLAEPARAVKTPVLLLALACERLAEKRGDEIAEAVFGAALARPCRPDSDHDALRRIAYAANMLASTHAGDLATYYAELCERCERPAVPLLWPRRTRGDRLRVLVVVSTLPPDSDTKQAFAALASLPADRFHLQAAIVGAAVLPPGLSCSGDGIATLALPTEPGAAEARRLAVLDADVMVDLAGLTAGAGRLLAERPARLRVTVATLPARNSDTLVDRVLADPVALVDALTELQRSLPAAELTMLDPRAMESLWTEGLAAHKRGDRSSARQTYEQVLSLQPGFAPAHFFLGAALQEDGEGEAARVQFAAALASAPNYVEARVAAMRAATEDRAFETAERLGVEGIDLVEDPPPTLLRALGAARLAAHDGAGAAAMFEAVLAHDPQDGETHYNHGVALQMQHRHAKAVRAYQRALTFQPELVAADFNLGVIFGEMGNPTAAIAAFTQVVSHDPRHVAAYKNLGETLFATGQIDAWLANFERFERHCPNALPLAVQALEACSYLGDFARLERYIDGLRRERFTAADDLDRVDSLEQLLYLLLYFDVEPEMIHRFALTYDEISRRVYGEPLPRTAPRRAGKLRIGYLSGDFRNHVMGKMVLQALRHHDRNRFELFFYALSTERDAWTEQFEALGSRFDVIARLDEAGAARHIARDDLDILVDLSTHTKGAKPGILAFKPARVQITHVASAGTVGLSTIDFKLTDRYADVPENQAYQLETMLPMEGCVYPYRTIAAAAPTRFHRESLGIGADAVVIGAFVSLLKLSRRCLGLWREVLERIPRARLAFSPPNSSFRASYARIAAAAGISADRIVFVPHGRSDEENQARYALVDLVLDPLPFGGVNGTLEALDMGVPVVTLRGRRHGERTSYSIMANLGVLQTTAETGREYVEIATRLASDPAFMGQVRAAIRSGLARSSLTDMERHTRNLEAAYIEALQRKAPEALADAEATATVR